MIESIYIGKSSSNKTRCSGAQSLILSTISLSDLHLTIIIFLIASSIRSFLVSFFDRFSISFLILFKIVFDFDNTNAHESVPCSN